MKIVITEDKINITGASGVNDVFAAADELLSVIFDTAAKKHDKEIAMEVIRGFYALSIFNRIQNKLGAEIAQEEIYKIVNTISVFIEILLETAEENIKETIENGKGYYTTLSDIKH